MSSNIDEKKEKKNKIRVATSAPKSCMGAKWLRERSPNVRILDRNWTMERYDYPDYVRQYIKDNWVEVSSNNGGTYAEPTWWTARTPERREFLRSRY